MTVAIVGCGVLGTSLSATLSNQGQTVYAMDTRIETFEKLPKSKINDGTIVPIVGDGTRRKDLAKLPFRDIDTLIAVTGSDTVNALVAQIAKRIHGIPSVICRIEDQNKREMYMALEISNAGATEILAKTIIDTIEAH